VQRSKREERPLVAIVIAVINDNFFLPLFFHELIEYLVDIALKIIVYPALGEGYLVFFYRS
jgi:hypothetical protein